MDAKNVLVSAGVALLVVVLGFAYFGPGKVIETVKEVTVGAIPGTSVDANCFSIGGVEKCYYSSAFQSATSTYCVYRLPTGTSTLLNFTARLDTSTGSITSLYLATSSAAYAPQPVRSSATTSNISSSIVAADATPTFFVSGGNPRGISAGGAGGGSDINATTTVNSVLEGNDYLVFYARGGGVALDTNTSAPHTGRCTAEILVQ